MVNYVKTFRHFSQKSEKDGRHIFQCRFHLFSKIPDSFCTLPGVLDFFLSICFMSLHCFPALHILLWSYSALSAELSVSELLSLLSTDIIFSTIELPTSYTILESFSCTYLLSPFSFPT